MFTIETFLINIVNKAYAGFYSFKEETKILAETNFRSFVFIYH